MTIDDLTPYTSALKAANDDFTKVFAGESGDRQPVHTVYGGAQLFKRDTASKLAGIASRIFQENCANAQELAEVFGLDGDVAEKVYGRVVGKLKDECIEDFRIDFEDGFGIRPNEEEDREAVRTAQEVAAGLESGQLPPFIGIRIKPLNEELKVRSLRTLDLFLTTLCEAGSIPDNFVVTLPKIFTPKQVEVFCQFISALEQKLGLEHESIKIEFMVELTQTLLDSDGRSTLPQLADAAGSRVKAAHFGTYDYTASCNITAAYQEMDHPACDFARSMMKIAYGGRPLWLSDGATNVMPVGDKATIHDAWRLAYKHTRHSLRNGFYQGWDLHPGQFSVRYVACYGFFLESLQAATDRLRGFMDKAAQATLLGDVFDDAATGQGLLNYFLRAHNCGAISDAEVTQSGLSLAELQTRSFVKILEARKQGL